MESRPSTCRGRARAAQEREEIAKVIRAGADSLFAQMNYVDMYTSKNESGVAEANIVINIAHAFLKEKSGHCVWAQSPFRSGSPRTSKWLDLVIDLNPAGSEGRTVVLLEAKRVLPSERAAKISEILRDWRRIQAWPTLPPRSVPIGVSLDPPRKVYGAIVVVVSAEPNSVHSRGKTVSPTFYEWWENLGRPPRNRTGRLFEDLESKLRDALKGCIRSTYSDGGRKIIVLYAVFEAK
ncbi:MAG: hypothetical protein ACLQVL_19055 [Terriglobia bacterium]